MNQMPQETASPLNPGNQEMSHQPKPGMSGAFEKPGKADKQKRRGELPRIDDGHADAVARQKPRAPDEQVGVAQHHDDDHPQGNAADEEHAEDAGDHEDAIHRRIEDLPQLRYRMGAPGQLSVDEVAGGSRSEDEGGGQVEAGEQQPQVHGHEAQAHEGDDVGRREDLACHLLGDLFPISLPFDHEASCSFPTKTGPSTRVRRTCR